MLSNGYRDWTRGASLVLAIAGLAESGCVVESDGASDGSGAGPGVTAVIATDPPTPSGAGAPGAPDVARPAPALQHGAQEQTLDGPQGVVLSDGRVVTEQEAATGLTPKSGVHTIIRMEGPFFSSSMSLFPTSTHVCVLSMIWGTLYGNVGWAIVEPEVGTWQLSSRKDDSGTKAAAEATCYPHSAFLKNSGVVMLSDLFAVYFSSAIGNQSAFMWWGDAASPLSGVRGKFFGAGEEAWVTQSFISNSASRLQLKTKQGGQHGSYGFSYFVGNPDGTHVPQFIGPNGVGSAEVAGEYVFGKDSRDDHFWLTPDAHMAHTSEAMCYLTSISGRWNGPNEWIQIFPDSQGFWVGKGAASGNDGRVVAKARCLKFDQRGE